MTTQLPDGAYCALVTPLGERGELDPAGLAQLLERVLAAGVRGLAPVGSTGEGPLLSRRLRLAVLEQVLASVPAGMPVIPGVVSTGLEEALTDLDAYGERGATVALVAPPNYYLHGADDAERFYELVADRSPIPIAIYNIPQLTKVPIPPAVVARLASHPSIIAIKDSSGNLENLAFLLERLPDDAEFSVFTGTDTLLVPSLVLGASGTIAASLNVAPSLATGICEAVGAGRTDDALALQERLLRLVDRVRGIGTPWAWKVALAALGVCGVTPAAPHVPAAVEDISALAKDLEAFGLD